MRSVEFECRNCGNHVYSRCMDNRGAVISKLKAVQKDIECCDDPDYEDKSGILRRMRESSVAVMY